VFTREVAMDWVDVISRSIGPIANAAINAFIAWQVAGFARDWFYRADRTSPDHRTLNRRELPPLNTSTLARSVTGWSTPGWERLDVMESRPNRLDGAAIARTVRGWDSSSHERGRRTDAPIATPNDRSHPLWDRDMDG
jgi:hypothetical protein